jgi:hypothetical protein
MVVWPHEVGQNIMGAGMSVEEILHLMLETKQKVRGLNWCVPSVNNFLQLSPLS